MDTNTLFDRLGSIRRDFSGNMQMTNLAKADSRFDASIDIRRDAAAMCVEGSFQQPTGQPVRFTLTLPFATAETPAPTAALSCALVGDISGPLLISADGFEFIATTPSATVTLNLRFTDQDSLLVKGMVFRQEGSLVFSASPVAMPGQRAKPKVFSIRPVRE